MASIHSASQITTPSGQLLGPSGPMVSLASTIQPMKEIWPAVDAVDGPITADTGIVAGSPDTTGLTLYAYDSGAFNTQSQYWITQADGSGGNSSGFALAVNASTPRTHGFGVRDGLPIGSIIDFGFVSDATTITLQYYYYSAYNFGSSDYHDHQIYAEHDGHMKKLTTLPATYTTGSGLMYRTITFKEAREREFRVMMPGYCWLRGVYINATATIRKSPNKFFVATNGDSWNEPIGNTLASPIGGAWPTGTYGVGSMSTMIAEATGWAVAQIAEGGTGEYNANDGGEHDANYTSSNGTSVFHGVTRINDLVAKFGNRNPLVWTIGGWNDGGGPAPYKENYKTRFIEGIDRFRTAKSDIQLLYSGIQPVEITPGDARDLANDGIEEACAERPDAVIGFIDMMPMWPDTTMSGQRGANVNASDTIHLHIKGAELVANWNLAGAKKFSIPMNYYTEMLAAS